MNEEEINEAIKLIKEPIIVNSVEYKYFNQENYEKLLRVYENCRWFIDNYEQVLQNIENLQQELKRKDNIINELEKMISEFDVFKEFTFPLMKRWEEEQVKSSIDYEWTKSIKEPFLAKLNELRGK